MDMSEAYEQETRAHCQAAIVYDLFHVVAKYGREVIDRVRVDETNRLARAHDRRHRAVRRVIKGTRWLLLRNRSHAVAPGSGAARSSYVVYVLKDALKQLWRYRYAGAARRACQWYGWAVAAGLRSLAHRRRPNSPASWRTAGIRCTPVARGHEQRIKVIKRMAYGFRDDAYFFLKIRAAFPGNP